MRSRSHPTHFIGMSNFYHDYLVSDNPIPCMFLLTPEVLNISNVFNSGYIWSVFVSITFIMFIQWLESDQSDVIVSSIQFFCVYSVPKVASIFFFILKVAIMPRADRHGRPRSSTGHFSLPRCHTRLNMILN